MDLITVECEEKGQAVIQLRGQRLCCTVPGSADSESVSPVELMVASLGACIAVMIDGYCRTHGYLDGRAAVCLTQQMGDEPRRVTAVTVDVELPRDFPEEKREVVRRLIDKCPVHSTFVHPPRIDLEIV